MSDFQQCNHLFSEALVVRLGKDGTRYLVCKYCGLAKKAGTK